MAVRMETIIPWDFLFISNSVYGRIFTGGPDDFQFFRQGWFLQKRACPGRIITAIKIN